MEQPLSSTTTPPVLGRTLGSHRRQLSPMTAIPHLPPPRSPCREPSLSKLGSNRGTISRPLGCVKQPLGRFASGRWSALLLAVTMITLAAGAMTHVYSPGIPEAGSDHFGNSCLKGATAREKRLEDCRPLLPSAVVNGNAWLIGIHMDRARTNAAAVTTRNASSLRGELLQRRVLPHQYFHRVTEGTLRAISEVDPEANVDMAIFTQERFGGMLVDEAGVPLDWEIPRDICEDLGLHCTQTIVLLDDANVAPVDALECIAAADVLIADEDKLSKAALSLSKTVKIVTDQWNVADSAETDIVVLNPLTAMAGEAMSSTASAGLRRAVHEYHDCAF